MAAKLDLTIDKGATFRHTFRWYSRSGGVNTPVNLSGFSARMKIREKVGDADPPLAELTTGNGGIVLEAGGVTGKIDLYIPDAVTAAYTWNTGVYDLELIDGVGSPPDVTRLVGGRVAATDEVTT
jgi:hypothetical protein